MSSLPAEPVAGFFWVCILLVSTMQGYCTAEVRKHRWSFSSRGSFFQFRQHSTNSVFSSSFSVS